MEKLKSRKFWITIVAIATAIITGLTETGVEDSTLLQIVCIICAVAAAVAYVIADAVVDASNAPDVIIEETITDEGGNEYE